MALNTLHYSRCFTLTSWCIWRRLYVYPFYERGERSNRRQDKCYGYRTVNRLWKKDVNVSYILWLYASNECKRIQCVWTKIYMSLTCCDHIVSRTWNVHINVFFKDMVFQLSCDPKQIIGISSLSVKWNLSLGYLWDWMHEKRNPAGSLCTFPNVIVEPFTC